MNTTQVLIADAHPSVCEGVRHVLADNPAVHVRGCARDATEVERVLAGGGCDVLVSEFALWDARGGAHPLSALRQRHPGLKIVILTHIENAGVVHALLSLGMDCIVSKADELSHLAPAILRAHGGGRYLSPRISALSAWIGQGKGGLLALSARELEVVALFLSGMTINEIAGRLGRSKKTISSQKVNAMEKLGVQSDIELLRYGMETGLVHA